MIDYGNTIAKLTVAQLRAASADLRNAALVVKHSGHFKGALVDRETGGCCMSGAIDLATYRELYKYASDQWNTAPQFMYIDQGCYRAENAVLVLAEFIPDKLCHECDDDYRCECNGHLCDKPPREPWEKVVHYNDNHCAGGTMAVNVLRLAADAADHWSNQKEMAVAPV